MAAGKRRKKNNMMSVLFIPLANMRHKNVKNEKKQKNFFYDMFFLRFECFLSIPTLAIIWKLVGNLLQSAA